ncbi:hypothetical protein D3C85_552840 [compost metagenome]
MLPSQLAPFELVYLNQSGDPTPVPRNELRKTFQTFENLIHYIQHSPDHTLEGYNLVGLGFEMLEQSTTEVVGVMGYYGKQPEVDGRKGFNFRMFRIRGPLPEDLLKPSYIDFTAGV